MADNNINVIDDQDFYGTVRFFGGVTVRGVGSFSLTTPSRISFGLASIYHNNAQFEFNPSGIGSVFFISNSLVQTTLRMKSGTGVGCSIEFHETPSGTNPVFCPNENDQTTGIGASSAGYLSLIAGGLEALRVSKNTTEPTAPDLTFPLPQLSGLSATPTNLQLEALIGAPDEGTVMIVEDSDNARVLLLVRYNTRWRFIAFGNTA